MRKFWIVLVHTFMSRLKTKVFLISTLFTMLFVIGGTNIENIKSAIEGDKIQKIAVLDKTGELYTPFQQQMKLLENDISIVSSEQEEAALKEAVKTDEFTGFLVLSYNEKQLPQATYTAEDISDDGLTSSLTQALQQIKVEMATKQLGLNQAKIAQIYQPVVFETVALEQATAKTGEELMQARLLVQILLFIIYFFVLLYGTLIATEVATEKSSRVMEILVSSVAPVKQMFGKILGVTALGLSQLLFLAVVGYVSFLIGHGESGTIGDFLSQLSVSEVPFGVLLYGIVFLILGFLLYGTLMAMIGSLVDRVEDINTVQTPIIILLVVGFMIGSFGLQQPDSPVITMTSFIPFFSPMIMFLRIGMLSSVPIWEVALSIGLLVATVALFVFIGARVYRGGVLLYGKSSLWKSLKQALVLTKSAKG